jgi:hypothetical protein
VELERGRTRGELVSVTLEAAAVVVITTYIITGSCLVCDLWHVAAGRHQTGACLAVVVIDLSKQKQKLLSNSRRDGGECRNVVRYMLYFGSGF